MAAAGPRSPDVVICPLGWLLKADVQFKTKSVTLKTGVVGKGDHEDRRGWLYQSTSDYFSIMGYLRCISSGSASLSCYLTEDTESVPDKTNSVMVDIFFPMPTEAMGEWKEKALVSPVIVVGQVQAHPSRNLSLSASSSHIQIIDNLTEFPLLQKVRKYESLLRLMTVLAREPPGSLRDPIMKHASPNSSSSSSTSTSSSSSSYQPLIPTYSSTPPILPRPTRPPAVMRPRVITSAPLTVASPVRLPPLHVVVKEFMSKTHKDEVRSLQQVHEHMLTRFKSVGKGTVLATLRALAGKGQVAESKEGGEEEEGGGAADSTSSLSTAGPFFRFCGEMAT